MTAIICKLTNDIATPDEVRQTRMFLGMTQDEMGRRMGVGYHSVYRWEAGMRPMNADNTALLRRLKAQKIERTIQAGRKAATA